MYDSERDFEFEISVANLLYILQETSSIKGKGLEGKFVYAWDGKDLVLLPESAQEYQACLEFTANQAKKVTARELVAEVIYKTKKGEDLIYLGKLATAIPLHKWLKPCGITVDTVDVKHIFVPVTNPKTDRPTVTSSLTSLAYAVSTDISPDFLDALMYYQSNRYGSRAIKQDYTTKPIYSTGGRKVDVLVLDVLRNTVGVLNEFYGTIDIKWSQSTLQEVLAGSPYQKVCCNSPVETYTNKTLPNKYVQLSLHTVLESGVIIPNTRYS